MIENDLLKMIEKIDNKKELTEQEIKDFIDSAVDEKEVDEGRWSKTIASFIHEPISDRWFCVDWERGLTEYQEKEYPWKPFEYQENEYQWQPFEVIRKEETVTQTIVTYEEKQ